MQTLATLSIETPLVLYIASALGAVALYLMMPKRQLNWRLVGALLGAATLGGSWFFLSKKLPWSQMGISNVAFIYYYIFSAISIIAAIRVITQKRPIYSALWFVLVVLSSAGLFIVLGAQFMAFAMVIIYGGAILVTYMFVIMLASHSGDAEYPEETPEYDRIAREPLFAIAASFVFLAVLLNVSFNTGEQFDTVAQGPSDKVILTDYLAGREVPAVEKQVADAVAANAKDGEKVAAPTPQVTNIERVGLDLFRAHPLGLEIAGVILLISLVGAVVIAKTQVDEEDQVKQSA